MRSRWLSTFGLIVVAASILITRLGVLAVHDAQADSGSASLTLLATGLIVLTALIIALARNGDRRRRIALLRLRFPNALVFDVLGYGQFEQAMNEVDLAIDSPRSSGMSLKHGRRRIFVLDHAGLSIWPVHGRLIMELDVSNALVESIRGGSVSYAYGEHPALIVTLQTTRQVQLAMVVFRGTGHGMRIQTKGEIEALAAYARSLTLHQGHAH